jgi:hypothetical protein
VEEPLSVDVLFTHVIWDPPVAEIFGIDPFEVIGVVVVFVHPFAGFVTVSVYVPAALTVAVAVFAPDTTPGPDQLNVAPAVVDDPLTVDVLVVQVS